MEMWNAQSITPVFREFSLLGQRVWETAVTWLCCGSMSPQEFTLTDWWMTKIWTCSKSSWWRLCTNALRCSTHSVTQYFATSAETTRLHHVLMFVLVQGLEDKCVTRQPLIYWHFSQTGEESSYAPVTDWSVLSTVLTDALESYNDLNAAMDLVLFEDAMQHV